MIDILDRQVELVLVAFGVAAVLGPSIGQDPLQRDAVLVLAASVVGEVLEPGDMVMSPQ